MALNAVCACSALPTPSRMRQILNCTDLSCKRFTVSSTTPPAPHADIRALYIDHHAWLLDWLRKRLRHGDNAADLAHDTFVHILGKPERLQELCQPPAWVS